MDKELHGWIKKIIVLVIFFAIGYVIYTISSIIWTLLIAGFCTILINPLVDRWEKYRIPAWATITFVYIIILILGAIVIGTLIPIVITYVTDTITAITHWATTVQQIYTTEGISGFHLPTYIEKALTFLLGESDIEHFLDVIKQNAGNIQSMLTKQVSSFTTGSISFMSAVGTTIANWFMLGIMIFMMVIERKRIGKFILDVSPDGIDSYLRTHYLSIQKVCTSWIKATLILCVSIFALTYIGLTLVNLIFGIDTEKTFTLAIIGGIMEFVPYVGPIIALIPALIIGLGIGWEAAAILTILYLIIQQIENNFLVPYVMSKSLDLSPFLVFVMMLIGATLGGILGIILAIPVAGIARIMYLEYLRRREKRNYTEPIIEEKIEEETEEKPTKKIAKKD